MKNKIIVKSNFLIEASYKLSVTEQRIILFLTSMIKPEDKDFGDYSFSVKEFSALVGIRYKGEYESIKILTKKLISRVFVIKDLTGVLQISWLSSAKYINGKGIVTLRFDPNLKPYLLQLKNRFTKYNFHLVMQLKSFFSIRIYELLKQYENLGERYFVIEDLRERLGIGKDQYKLYGHFKAKVLNVAQKELTEKTDISFHYEEIKIGRKVGKIKFIIIPKAHQKAIDFFLLPENTAVLKPVTEPQIQENSEVLKLYEIIPQVFRSKESVKNLVRKTFEKHSFDYVMRNIVYTNDKSNAVKPGSNLDKGSNYRVYLSKALCNDYGLAYMEDREVKKEIKEKQQRENQEQEYKKQKEMTEIAIERENREKARIYMSNLAPETIKNLEEKAKKHMSFESLERLRYQHYVGIFEFKRKMEEVVMELMHIRESPSVKQQFSEPQNSKT